MRKYPGTCPRCGPTTVGVKRTSFSNRGRGMAPNPDKAGNTKCLTCQKVQQVTVGERR
jgi:hypothetical protein